MLLKFPGNSEFLNEINLEGREFPFGKGKFVRTKRMVL